MTRKRRRLYLLLACGIGLGSAAALTLLAFSDSLVFFVSPSDVAAKGGDGGAVFKVTDGTNSITVRYAGILPDLFREGQGVVTLGTLQPDGSLRASEVLAKHDETYMPKEVADALKKSGHWNPVAGPPPPASTWNTVPPKGGS